jgi:hypothetical protein
MTRSRESFVLAAVLSLLIVWPGEAAADSVGFSWTGFVDDGGTQRAVAGAVNFELTGSTLTVTLTNTLGAAEASQIQALTGLTWDMSGASITGVSAALASGSGWVDGLGASISAPGSVGQFWAFKDDLNVPGFGGIGVSAVGDLGGASTGVFGSGDMIAGGGPGPQPNGTGGGLVGTFFAGLPGGQNRGPFIQNSAVLTFALNSTPGSVAGLNISNVRGSYGSDGNGVSVPEPVTLHLLGLALVGLAGAARRRGRR